MTLTPTEQRVYKEFYDRVCTLDEVSKFLKNYRQAVVACKNLVEKEYFKRIKGGLYATVPYEMAPDSSNMFVPDRYMVGDRMIKDRFLSHHTALELYCEAKQLPTVFISSPGRVPGVSFAGITYEIITTKHFFGFKDFKHKTMKLKVSDKERTIMDCLRQIKYTNGFEELKELFPKLGTINFDMLLHYVKKVDEKSLYSRIGYAMHVMKDELNTPQEFLDAVKAKLSKRAHYLDPSKKGSYVKEWKIIA